MTQDYNEASKEGRKRGEKNTHEAECLPAGGENKTFIGSADWMPRNLDNRVEVITPVYDSRIKEDLWKVIDFGLRDNCQGSVVDGSGKNCLWTTDTEESFRSQEELYKYYKSHITND